MTSRNASSFANTLTSSSFTQDLVTNCFYALAGATCLMILCLIYFISFTTGAASLYCPKNSLLFGILVSEFGIQVSCALDISNQANEGTSVFRYMMVALFQTLFLWYQWLRCYTLIQAEMSQFSIRVIRGVLIFVTPLLYLQPLLRVVSVIGQRAATGLSALLVVALDIFFGVICREGLVKRAEQVQEVKGEHARGVTYTKIIAKYGYQASVYLLLSFVAQTANIVVIILFRKVATAMDSTLYGIFLITTNVFVFMTVATLVLMKIKLTTAFEAPSVKPVAKTTNPTSNMNHVAQVTIASSRVISLPNGNVRGIRGTIPTTVQSASNYDAISRSFLPS
ncbi:UNVERIFIED_CONTAM: hypothetical protein HDU68_001897 [Siphonaria sp. JEL0065]|nr:hypothetical protein HDU68_001897 [Siphonaria sp. JEL0065]